MEDSDNECTAALCQKAALMWVYDRSAQVACKPKRFENINAVECRPECILSKDWEQIAGAGVFRSSKAWGPAD